MCELFMCSAFVVLIELLIMCSADSSSHACGRPGTSSIVRTYVSGFQLRTSSAPIARIHVSDDPRATNEANIDVLHTLLNQMPLH